MKKVGYRKMVDVSVDVEEIVASLAESSLDALEVITSIDLAVQDTGFTEDVIKSLMKSLKGDLDPDGWATLLEELKSI